jgi:hypothetical protein
VEVGGTSLAEAVGSDPVVAVPPSTLWGVSLTAVPDCGVLVVFRMSNGGLTSFSGISIMRPLHAERKSDIPRTAN